MSWHMDSQAANRHTALGPFEGAASFTQPLIWQIDRLANRSSGQSLIWDEGQSLVWSTETPSGNSIGWIKRGPTPIDVIAPGMLRRIRGDPLFSIRHARHCLGETGPLSALDCGNVSAAILFFKVGSMLYLVLDS